MGRPRVRGGGSSLYEYAEHEVLVVCPRCSARAVVRRGEGRARRLTCAACALARDADGSTSRWGGPVDPWFGAPLWLQAPFREHTVWAFNQAHLDAVRAFVAADLRERTPMLAKLPAWLTSAKHRDDVLAVLDRLAVSPPCA